jgi:hypothetical protein
MNIDDLTWLEDRKGCSRYALGDEESLWICAECLIPADPDEGGCEECHPENFIDDDEECAA